MTPAQQQAARIEKDVEASALGRELMMPMPEGWGRSMYEHHDGSWEVVATHNDHWNSAAKNRHNSVANAKHESRTEAHRLCREQAWAKHKKNTEETNAKA